MDHDVLDLVADLRLHGYCCALATNQQPHRASFMMRQLRYREAFDRCFFSCDLGFAKPDPRYFETVLAELRIDADDVIFVDDKPANLLAARSLGIHAICFANSKDGSARAVLRQLLAPFGVASAA